MPKQPKAYSKLKKGSQTRSILAQAKKDLNTLTKNDSQKLILDLVKSTWGKPILNVIFFYK